MKLNKKLFFYSIVLLFLPGYLAMSQVLTDSISYVLESGVSAATARNSPFWFVSNRYGLLSTDQYNVWIRAKLIAEEHVTKKIDFSFGIDAVERYSGHNDLFIQQAYVGVKFGFLTFKGGKWEEKFGNQDWNLSSGGILWSGNAQPVPKISILVPSFTPIPLTKGYAEFKGGISHGWFDDNQYMKNTLLHHKYLYLKFGGSLPVHLHVGLQHFAQWGGISSDPEIGQLPHDLSTFIRIFFAKGGARNDPQTEWENVAGNHLGSYNLGVDLELKKCQFNFYWQTIFEDGSGRRLRNIKDGLWGLKVSPKSWKYLTGILVEYLRTTDQSGTYDKYIENDTIKYAGGNDDYFNNGIYYQGWTTKGMTIGTPLITSPAFMVLEMADYLINNKLSAFHFGLEGRIKNVDYKAFYTFSRNFGTNSSPFLEKKDQNFILIEGSIADVLPWDLSISAAVAFDIGKFYKKNVGVMFCLKKEGLLRYSESLK